ncbi:hypothetical protein ACWOAH_00005 [Vagococcus vulneris]|uniref:Uncharacterized protein n=1 Tax=Vagococcus vulneris TaxID=1977869 RepID=A0A430A2S9_9ENTE|nr:hypothetical protein [Vagococcus vulneris]RSU00717.1 hypothetical protein CBF37_01525 [Vagococcus vulneris]
MKKKQNSRLGISTRKEQLEISLNNISSTMILKKYEVLRMFFGSFVFSSIIYCGLKFSPDRISINFITILSLFGVKISCVLLLSSGVRIN